MHNQRRFGFRFGKKTISPIFVEKKVLSCWSPWLPVLFSVLVVIHHVNCTVLITIPYKQLHKTYVNNNIRTNMHQLIWSLLGEEKTFSSNTYNTTTLRTKACLKRINRALWSALLTCFAELFNKASFCLHFHPSWSFRDSTKLLFI